MTLTPTPTLTNRINTTAADELDEIRREIGDQLTVKIRLESEGDPDVERGTHFVETVDIEPHARTLTIDKGGRSLPLIVEGSKDGVRWTATLDHYDRKNGGYADFDVEIST